MRNILIVFIVLVVAGSFLTSCHYNPVVVHQCDTCTKPCDTCTKPCDTCNLNKDSLAHAFIWTEYINKMPGEADITGCWVFGPNDIYMIGTNLWHYDGNTFTQIPSFYSDKPTIMVSFADFTFFAFSKSDFWAVSGSIAFHTNDGKYFDRLQPGIVNSCWGASSNDMFFVGNGGHIAHWDGIKFTDMASNTTEDLQSIWGTNSKDVWASGFNYSTGGTVIEHYDGNSWSVDNLGNTSSGKRSGLSAVWTCDSLNHKFVVTSGAFVYRKTDNGMWRNDSGMIQNSLGNDTYVALYLLRGNSPSDMMASGSWGWVGHWNGKTWKKYDQLYDYNNGDYISKALSVNGNTACVVGTKSGASWVAIGQRKQ